jgi:hypothetical protein
MAEQGVRDAVADAFAAAGDDGDFAGEVWGLVEGELVGGKLGRWASQVLRDGVLGDVLVP